MSEIENEHEVDVTIDPTFKRTQETLEYDPDKTTNKSWQAVRDECRSGGAMDERCNIVAAANGSGRMDVVAKRLACGCILIPDDVDEVGL